MAKLNWIFTSALSVLLSSAAMAAPVTENWVAPRNSYDVHACGASRFVLGEQAGQSSGAVAHFTVLPGDSCIDTKSERSEVVLDGWRSNSRFQVQGDEGTEYYRISIKLASGWMAPQVNAHGFEWGTFFQLHGPNQYSAPPAIALNVENEFSLFVLGGDMNRKVGGKRFLTNPNLNVGSWVEFVLKIKWAPDASGAISVYRRDDGETAWSKVADIGSVATLQYKGNEAPKAHYWKAGFYRSGSQFVNSLWLGPILRGRTFEEVTGQ